MIRSWVGFQAWQDDRAVVLRCYRVHCAQEFMGDFRVLETQVQVQQRILATEGSKTGWQPM